MSELAREADNDSAEMDVLHRKKAKQEQLTKQPVNQAFLLPRSAWHTWLRTPPFWDEAYAQNLGNYCTAKNSSLKRKEGRTMCLPVATQLPTSITLADYGGIKQQNVAAATATP